MSKFNVGDKVRYIGKDHDNMPAFYPPVGTIGTVIKQLNEYDNIYIQWEKGSTSKGDCWYCDMHDIELVKDEDMTNEEIWEMMRPKMEKNALTTKNIHAGLFGPIYTYNAKDVHNAVALSYKVGYLRAMKGRPFKIGEKKKGGHWEPVDPNNLPKEGTKVRYSRKNIDWSNSTYIEIGDTGTVQFWGSYFGFNLDAPKGLDWICILTQVDCLDIWVEDDE